MIKTNGSTNNDNLKVANETTIGNFKQTFNSFISKLKDASTLNLIINPTMKHMMGNAAQMPYEWKTQPANEGKLSFTNTDSVLTSSGRKIRPSAPTQILFDNTTNTQSRQGIFQIIDHRLKPNTEYTLAFSFSATQAFEVSLVPQNGGGIIDLRDEDNATGILTSTVLVPEVGTIYEDYFNFVTGDDITGVEFHITSLNPAAASPANIIEVNRLHLFEGSIEFTNGYSRTDFEDNVHYDNTIGQWALTNNGIDYHPFLTAGDLPDTINMDVKLNTGIFGVEHDIETGFHTKLNLLDPKYKIGYTLLATDNQTVVATSPTILIETPTVTHNDGVWDVTHTYGLGDVVTDPNMKWRSMQANNTGNNPNVYNGDWWDQIPNGTKLGVEDTFPAHAKAYYKSHNQLTLGTAGNGDHLFVDTVTGTKYVIDAANASTEVALKAAPVAPSNTNANELSESFKAFHDGNGEFVVRRGVRDARIFLRNGVLRYETDSLQLADGPYTRQSNESDVSDLTKSFDNPTLSFFHDTDGNHIVREMSASGGDGLWLVEVANGAFKFTPTTRYDETLAEKFELFRREHDKYGRHVLRDEATGIFYHVVTNVAGTGLSIHKTIFEPPDNIDQFLSIYNAEHDNDNHYFRKLDGTSGFFTFGVGTEGGPIDSLSTVVSAKGSLTHPSDIMTGGIFIPLHHSDPAVNQMYHHRIRIVNGVIFTP